MSETVANLTDSIEYDHEIDTAIEGYVFYDDNGKRYAITLTTYGYQVSMPNISVNVTDIRTTEFNQVELLNDHSYISTIHETDVPDDMFKAINIIAEDN